MSESGQDGDRRSRWEEPDEASRQAPTSPSPGDAETTAVPVTSDDGDPYRQAATRSVPQRPAPSGGTAPDGAWSSPQEQPQPPQWGGQHGQAPDGYPPVPQQQDPSRYAQPQYAQDRYVQGANQAWGGPAGYPQQAPVAGAAQAVLWTAVGGLVLLGTGLGWIAAIVALALTPGARRTVLESGGAQRGLGHLFAGKVVAWVTIGLTVLTVVGIALLFGLVLSGPGSYADYDFDTVGAVAAVPGA